MIAIPVRRGERPRLALVPHVEEPPPFIRFVEAARWWRQRDTRALDHQMRPPVDAIDDEIYDVALAVAFRHVVRAPDDVVAVQLIQSVFGANVAARDAYARRLDDPTAIATVDVLTRFLGVLERWRGQVAEEGL